MMKSILIAVLIVAPIWLAAQATKDSLILNNGSLIIGELKKVKMGVLTFDPDDANDITVQLRKIKTLSAGTMVYRIETVDDKVYYGILQPSDSANYVWMVQGSNAQLIFLQDISALTPFEKAFAQRFSGNVGLGYSYTRSSDFGRFNFEGKLVYRSKREEITLSTSGIYTITDTSFSRDREEVSIKNNFYFTSTWFATLFLTYQRNLELGLQRRLQEGLGIGNKFITNKNIYAWARTGFVFNQEKNTEGSLSGTLTEVFGQLEFNFFKFTKPEISLNIVQAFYYNLSQSGRFRNDGETNLSWEIIEDLDLNLTFYHNYDSKPPLEGSRNLDFGIVFGIAYSF